MAGIGGKQYGCAREAGNGIRGGGFRTASCRGRRCAPGPGGSRESAPSSGDGGSSKGSPLHFAEFTMLEWYRVDARADTVMRDVEELVRTLARSIAGGTAVRRGNRTVRLDRLWPRWELDDAFRELLGVGMSDEPGLREALTRRGERPGADESWEDLFPRACVGGVEPALAGRGACLLTGYPP